MKLQAATCIKFLTLVLISVLPYLPTLAQKSTSLQKVQNYISQNHVRLGVSPSEVNSITITHEYVDASTGIQHIYATQKFNGLVVANSNFSLHTNESYRFETNQLVSTAQFKLRSPVTQVSSQQAVETLMAAVNYSGEKKLEIKQQLPGLEKTTIYKRGSSAIWDIPVRLVYFKSDKTKSLHASWEVQMMDINKQHYWVAYVDASSGKILEKKDLILKCQFGGAETDKNAYAINHATHKHHLAEATIQNQSRKINLLAIPANAYRVYDLPLESPVDNIQQPAPHEISTRAGDIVASPDGWHRVGNATTYPYSRGNNVWAFQDPSPGPLGGVPSADPTRTAYPTNTTLGVPPVNEPFVFDYPVSLTSQPEAYQKAAIVNLFYWNNLMHDVFYQLGFTEAAGNFQESHTFSTGTKPGGLAGDAVLAQAQDGGGTNNANFLTLPDGSPAGGQMQMYLWTGSFPDSLVQITSSTTGIPPASKKFIAVQGSFSTAPTANTNLHTNPVINKQFVIIQKNALSTVGSSSEGCTTGQQSVALAPSNNVTDKIVLIDRGSCSFTEKVLSAQQGGAAGVIVINNADGPPQAMGGTDAPGNLITIPAVMISKGDGQLLKSQLTAGATIIGSLKQDAPPPPKRDGDFDNGVIAHEYGHGISSRMTAPNTLGALGGDEQGGEGWSDFMGIYMTMRTNDLLPGDAGHPNGVLPTRSIGNYVTYQPADGRGIRPTPYSLNRDVNPSTFKDIGKGGEITIPHGVGYIWATMLYELMQHFIDQYGMGDDVYEGANPTASKMPPANAKGNNIAMRLVMEGMKLQGTSPTFTRQRDAILKADTLLYNGMHSCRIWKAFASRGLGFSAQSNSDGVGDEFESFDLPLACDPNQKRVRIEKSGPIKVTNGAQINYTIKVKNLLPLPLNNFVVTDTLPPSLSFVSASNSPVVTGNLVKWTLSLPAGDSVTINLKTQLNSAGSSIQTFGDDHEVLNANFIAANQGGIDTWTRQSNASQAFSGSSYWFVPDTDIGGANTTLRTASPISIPANAELVFIHKFLTESGFDGGVVEVSTDNVNWTYVPAAKFIKGSYNATIATADNPGIGATSLAAFTGASPGYQVSIAKLNDYANQSIYVRFRFTADAAGGSVAGGGWWIDDVYVLLNRTEITNKASAITTPGTAALEREGTNAQNSTTGFVLGGSTLPSNLGALSASLVRNKVELSWKTLNETNTSSFDVERKATANTSFEKIGTVTALRGSGANQYRFSDANVLQGSKYQYRIKQVNNNGEYYYTNIAIVSFGGKAFSATIYPNPARSIANLTIANPDGAKVFINLYDVMGRRIGTFAGTESANQLIPIPVQTLSPGSYWIEVRSGENSTTLKLEVNK